MTGVASAEMRLLGRGGREGVFGMTGPASCGEGRGFRGSRGGDSAGRQRGASAEVEILMSWSFDKI